VATTRPANQQVLPAAAHQHVVARATHQGIVPRAPAEPVSLLPTAALAGAIGNGLLSADLALAKQPVITRPTIKNVTPAATDQDVRPRAGTDGVAPRAPVQNVIM
jgi:hypothetical protein